jgi:N-acetylglucosaminyldiphosphoundecaprenol N-acetyl-beta-D-mannosaminyltransferase
MTQIYFGNAAVDAVTKTEVLAYAREAFLSSRARAAVVITVNGQFIHLANHEKRFAKFLECADLRIADGMSLVFASKLLGVLLPERIAGIDLVVDLCAVLEENEGSVYFLGGNPGTANHTAEKLKKRFSKLRVAGVDCPPFGFEKSINTESIVLQNIQAAHPDLLLVGLGAPKQEYWIEKNLSALPCKMVVGVGCTFDVLSGQTNRAPLWMQRCGLEWFFRFCSEPRRLGRRYLVTNSYFLWLIFKQMLRGKR